MLLGIRIFIAAVTEESVKYWIETEKAVILSPGQGTHSAISNWRTMYFMLLQLYFITRYSVCV